MIACVDSNCEDDDEDIADLTKRVRELETIVRAQSAFIDELTTAAGYSRGEAFTARALVARLRDGDR